MGNSYDAGLSLLTHLSLHTSCHTSSVIAENESGAVKGDSEHFMPNEDYIKLYDI